MEKSKKKKVSWFEVLLYVYLIGFVGFLVLLPTPFKKSFYRRNDPVKTCFSNQRVLQGAVEMYNMDSEIIMKDFDINTLLNGNYLKGIPKKPDEECDYVGHNLDGEGYVYCIYHGDNQRKIPGSYKGEKGNFINYIKSRTEILPEAILWPFIIVIYFLQLR